MRARRAPRCRRAVGGLSTPVGFKNGSSGDSSAAIEAVSASAGPHAFLSVSKQGVAGIVDDAVRQPRLPTTAG